MRTPGLFFRASHVLVFVLIIGVLSVGLYASLMIITSPGGSSVAPFIDGIRLRP